LKHAIAVFFVSLETLKNNTMKRNLLIASLLLTGAASAQFTQANEPAIGAGQAMYELDTLAPDFASSTGSGQTWDYSTTAGMSSTTRAFTVEDPSLTPEGSNFPTATKAIVIEGFMTTYISSTASTRNSQGFSFVAGGPIGTVNAKLNTDDELLMNYPMALSNSLVDVFSGTAATGAGNFPCTGNNVATVDGTGTLILNAATTIPNVIRYHLIDTAHANTGLFGNVDMIRSQYEYYALGTNTELPLFVYTKLQIILGGSPTETSYALSYVAPDAYLAVSNKELSNITVYPNPATETISVKGLTNNATLTLVDAAGKTVSTATAEPGAATMSIGNVTAGVYFLHVASNNATSVQRVVIR
jgi:hypothetical protein